MHVRDLMTKDPVTAGETTTATEVARLMKDRNVGAVVVVDDNDRCKGIVTDRQITVHIVGEGRDPDGTPVKEIMTGDVATVREDQTIFDAAQLCFERGPFRRLPVVNDSQQVVGVISVADLAIAAHPLIEAVLAETEASVDEARVEESGIKRVAHDKVRKLVKSVR